MVLLVSSLEATKLLLLLLLPSMVQTFCCCYCVGSVESCIVVVVVMEVAVKSDGGVSGRWLCRRKRNLSQCSFICHSIHAD